MDDSSDTEAMRITGEILIAYLAKESPAPEELPQLVREVRNALRGENKRVAPVNQDDPSIEPAVSAIAQVSQVSAANTGVDEVAENSAFLICLEDGRPFRSLKRHLAEKHGLTPEEYRKKWGLAEDAPMVAADYAAARSDIAKRIGLGGARPRKKAGRR